MKILCICPFGIGNYLLCYPAWRLLRSKLPHAGLHLLALRRQIIDLAGNDPLWNSIHFIEPGRSQTIQSLGRFMGSLRREKFDASMSFFPSNTWQYNMLPFVAGAKERHAFRYDLKKMASLSILNTHLIPVDPALHDVQQNIMLSARFAGCDPDDAEVIFPQLHSADERESARIMVKSDKSVHIAIHPGSSAENGMDAKRWPAERFGRLADRICERLGADALILGGPDEKGLKQTVAKAMRQPSRIIDPQPLTLTAALLGECTLCLCNDSGIMHLAASVGTPTVAIFGPTDERRNGPWGDRHCIIRKNTAGFPLWTAANVGSRRVPPGIDPMQSLLDLSVDDAWETASGFVGTLNVV